MVAVLKNDSYEGGAVRKSEEGSPISSWIYGCPVTFPPGIPFFVSEHVELNIRMKISRYRNFVVVIISPLMSIFTNISSKYMLSSEYQKIFK